MRRQSGTTLSRHMGWLVHLSAVMRAQAESILMESTGLSECLDRLASQMELLRPGSTYRLQFNKDFRFKDAKELIPYLRNLGITTCYASPILKAQAGSMHGYDISDHNQINPEIGTEEEFQEMVAQLKVHGMSLLLDTVPNHMGVGHGQNPWWQDVLENGSASKFAGYL